MNSNDRCGHELDFDELDKKVNCLWRGYVFLIVLLLMILFGSCLVFVISNWKKPSRNSPIAVTKSGIYSSLELDLEKNLVFMTLESSQDNQSYIRSLPLEVCYFMIVPDYNSSETALAAQNTYHTFKISHTKLAQDGSVWGYCYMFFVSEAWARENLWLSNEEINYLIAVKG